MTFIAGYLYKNSVQIIVDSAMTYDGVVTPIHHLTSFGESVIWNESIEGDETMDEAAQKLFALTENIVLTFTGLVKEGTDAVKDLRQELKLNKKRVADVLNAFFDKKAFQETAYLVGFISDGNPVLGVYGNAKYLEMVVDKQPNNDEAKLISVYGGSGIDIQTLTDYIDGHIEENISASVLNRKQMLIGTIAVVQSATMNDPVLKKGVGGFFNGVFVDTEGIHWAKDTCYLTYFAKNFSAKQRMQSIWKQNREGVSTIHSSYRNISAIYFDRTLAKPKWGKKWLNRLLALRDANNADFFIFLALDCKRIVILDTEKIKGIGKLLSLVKVDQDEKTGTAIITVLLSANILSMLTNVSKINNETRNIHIEIVADNLR